MKKYFSSKTMIALAVAIAAAAAYETEANEQPMPPPASVGALPDNILPGTPTAEVVKLVQAGVDVSVIQNYISSCSSAFNIDADKIISLTDAGVPTDMVNAMIAHDKNLSASAPPVAPAPADNVPSAPPSAPPTEVNMNDFNNFLSPYGSWVEVEGYGRCWRPTVVVYDSTWRPYCDRGHWVYTDCGWYWDSDYSWGVTFHYGRWFRHDRFGWCWYPDTVWAPSWVTWRSGGEYCGWAPLPPFAVYRPGLGFYYRGASVSVGFDFGLGADFFTFVSVGHLCERHPRYFREEHERATQIFHQTTIINNYNVHDRTIVNGGISVDRINTVGHRPIQAVPVAQIPNAERHGWRGNDADRHPVIGSPAGNHDRNSAPGNSQLRHGPVIRNDQNNNVHPPTSTPSGDHSGNRNYNNSGTTPGAHPNVNPVNPPVVNNPHSPQNGGSVVHPSQPDNHSGNREIPSHNYSGAVPDTHQNVSPPVSGSPRQQTPPVVVAPHNPVAAESPQNNWQQNRNSPPQTPPVTTPRNSGQSASQYQPRSSDHGYDRNSDKDKQNH